MRILSAVLLTLVLFFSADLSSGQEPAGDFIKLPSPEVKGSVSVEEAIDKRISIRDFSGEGLSLEQVSQLLWAAGGATSDGITGATRAYPSAGGLYPLEIYLVAGNVQGLESGLYRYEWRKHALMPLQKGDLREKLARAALSQRMVREAPAVIVVAAKLEYTVRRYGQRGAERYVSMDAGHLGENVHLQAHSLGLGAVMVGAFSDKEVKGIIGRKDEMPLYMIPVGKPALRGKQ